MTRVTFQLRVPVAAEVESSSLTGPLPWASVSAQVPNSGNSCGSTSKPSQCLILPTGLMKKPVRSFFVPQSPRGLSPLPKQPPMPFGETCVSIRVGRAVRTLIVSSAGSS